MEAYRRAVLRTHDESLRLPIHLACDKNATLPVLHSLLDADVDKRTILLPDRWGDLPLHTACSRHQTDVVRLLIDSDSSANTLLTASSNGSLPIHAAIRFGAPAIVIKLLLDCKKSKQTLYLREGYGQTPLHAACRVGAEPDVVRLLLLYDEEQKTVMLGDNVGRLPLHLAILHCRENQLQIVKLLLQTMIVHRMTLRGLEQWKTDMNQILQSLQSVHERDFTTRDKLDMVCDTLRDFMERVHALELAVWRTSCLQFGQYKTMKEAIENESRHASGPFETLGYKRARRIQSGTEIIVRDVIPFLEDDPIDELLSVLASY